MPLRRYSARYNDRGYSDRYNDRRYDDDFGDLGRGLGDYMVLDRDAFQRGAFHGPIIRQDRSRDKKLQVTKWVREDDGDEYRYDFVKNIGVGGQGQCDLYSRASRHNKKLLVCKIMKHGFETAYDGNGKVKPAEAIILKDILGPHPLVCNLQAFTNHTFWFEYCGLGDLQDLCDGYIKHGTRVPESFVWHAYRQLAEAFAFIHIGHNVYSPNRKSPDFQTIIHRDVKPSNIFIREHSRNTYPDLVLADFGIATTTTALKRENGHLIGTPIYQPPEVPWHSCEGDIWSAGACIHALTTGSPPIKAVPRGQDSRKWYAAPDARAVADLRSLG
ncbi:MAG: hypothetical protein Q9226_008471, partial [Calogaya cf. arnoldii]